MFNNKVKIITKYLQSILFMAFKLAVATNSDCPPERKVTPGMQHGTVLRRAVTVASPISSAVALFGQSIPIVKKTGISYCY